MSDRAGLDVRTGAQGGNRLGRPALPPAGSRPAQRAGTVHTPVVLMVRWLRHRLDVRTLAGEAGLSIATA